MEQTKRKPKRKLTDISFESEDSHLALVHRDQGGPASGANYKLALKSLNLVQDAEKINKAEDTSVDTKSDSEVVISESDTSTNASVEKSNEVTASVNTTNKENLMKKETIVEKQEGTEVTKAVEEVQTVAKSEFEMLQKANNEQQVELQKALDEIKAYKAEKQEQVVKSKTSAITAVVKAANLQAPIVKAALALQDQKDFDAFVTALTEMTAQIEKSALFTEVGSAAELEVQIEVNPVAAMLKSKYAAK